MDIDELLRRRLSNEQLSQTPLSDPAAVVAWLGAVQSQDYYGASWALAQRVPAATAATIDRAFNEGSILRTHVMRPTWHFVAPADIRWLQALTGPRMIMAWAQFNTRLGIDERVIGRSQAVMVKALQGGHALTRNELDRVLQAAGIHQSGLGMAHLMARAERDALVCSGPRRGKQFTYMLLDERAPAVAPLSRDEALAELVRRYFTSHGPAQVQDCVWWSGLTVADTKQGLALLGEQLTCETVAGKDYWFAPAAPAPMPRGALLLPNYDEYAVAYRDRDAFFDPQHAADLDPRTSSPFSHTIVIQGRVRGFWKRTLQKDAVSIETRWLAPPTAAQQRAVAAAAKRYGAFLGLPARLTGANA